MKKKNLLAKILTTSFCAILISSTTVLAASSTLLTYNGEGIRSRPSVSSFSLSGNTTITINHKQTLLDQYLPQASRSKMTVSLQKKSGLFYNDTGDSMTHYGSTRGSKTMTKSSGTYRLYFEANEISSSCWPAFDITGSVTK